MDFPLVDLVDQEARYRKLIDVFHPRGLRCPRCGSGQDRLTVHRRKRDPVLDYRCRACGCVFNALTGTALQKTHRSPSELIILLRGFAQGATTVQLARELHRSRPKPEYARDDDGDGVREVHCNTIEGIWTGLRNFLRPFRGVNKLFLPGYVAIFQWCHNLKAATVEFLRALLAQTPRTISGT